MMFLDRTEAGGELARILVPLISPPAVVAAIPRGGVVVALPIVERLGVPLTVVYARKLTARVAPELAFGALDEDGEMQIEDAIVAHLELGPRDIEQAKAKTWAEIQRRITRYGVPPLAAYLPGSAVVLVDDGLATGLTMHAAVGYARRHGARAITVATPCASVQAADRFRQEADRFVGLVVDRAFCAVGDYYVDFSEVSDEEVIAMLAEAQEHLLRINHLAISLVLRRPLTPDREVVERGVPGTDIIWWRKVMAHRKSTIVRYRADLPPVDAYPRRIVSPPTAGPCCLQHGRQVGKERKEAGWRYIYVRCQVCGYTVRRILGRSGPWSPRRSPGQVGRSWRPAPKRSRRSDLIRRWAA